LSDCEIEVLDVGDAFEITASHECPLSEGGLTVNEQPIYAYEGL